MILGGELRKTRLPDLAFDGNEVADHVRWRPLAGRGRFPILDLCGDRQAVRDGSERREHGTVSIHRPRPRAVPATNATEAALSADQPATGQAPVRWRNAIAAWSATPTAMAGSSKTTRFE
ncbi:MAG: hypothetical protein NVS9B8_01910 [Candidatus Limnocylindrales bacterium]